MSVLALPIQLRTCLQYKYTHLMERVRSLRMMSRFLLLHSLILIPLFIAAATGNTSAITTDQDALLALKAHITHDPTNFLAKNWNTSTPVRNWPDRCRL